jgi:N-acetylglucosamine kinase-like BadF-type ATPase
MRYFLGVDGGQSSTTALIGDETGRILGTGRAGPCNHVGTGEGRARFVSAIGGSIAAARAEARIGDIGFEAACFGLSGGPEQQAIILAELISAARISVTNDAMIALVGACGGEPGVVAIAGTGSIAFGRNAAGKTARVGGWGYIFGDEGGGFDIARQALRAALRQEEGWGPETSLTARLIEATNARDVNEAMHLFYTADYPRDRVARFAVLVDQAAEAGDAVALRILETAAGELADVAGAVRAQLFQPGEHARVSYVGGVFRSRALLDRFRRLVEREPGNLVAPPLYGPDAGALIEAYRIAGLAPRLAAMPGPEK